jgi:hypothetical protein
MIPLVLTQIAVRWGQALTLLVLSMAATAAAVSSPLYADAVDRTAIANELTDGGGRARLASLPVWQPEPGPDSGDGFGAHLDVLSELPDFTPVVTSQVRVLGVREDAPPGEVRRLLARDGFCQHVRFQEGRCPVGSREAAMPATLAEQAGRRIGDQVPLTPVVFDAFGQVQRIGPPAPITLVGVFEARDEADPYWVAGLYPLGQEGLDGAVLTLPTTLEVVEREPVGDSVYVDAILPAARLTPERIPAIRDQLDAADERMIATGLGPSGLVTELPQLLNRITDHGEAARALLPVMAAPLVALCWLVIHLAVRHGVSARRNEIGVVALRGAKKRTRSAVVAAEVLVPVLVGMPAGVVAAYLLVAATGPAPSRVTVDAALLVPAALAAAGTVVAALLALGRELAAPVAQLIRRVPPRRRLAVAATEILAVGLAVAVVADLRVSDRELVGVAVVAPAVVMLAVAVLAARAVRSVIDLAGRAALRRGRLAPALAALYLARRPGAARLVVVLALALGMLGFAVASTGAAADGRATEAAQALGAARVLTVQQPDRGQLLAAVRAADPSGEYAMAVAATAGGPGEPPGLAVDSTRLAEVAIWFGRYGGLGPARVAELLRPPAPDPVLVDDGELVAELTLDRVSAASGWVVSLSLAPVGAGDGGGDVGGAVAAEYGPLRAGRHRYSAEVAGCAGGCRLAGLVLTPTAEATGGSEWERLRLTWHALDRDGVAVVPAEWLGDTDRWRSPLEDREPILFAGVDEGLSVSHPSPWPGSQYQLLVKDAPFPLPVVTTGALPSSLVANVDKEPIQVSEVATVAGLPGLGEGGLLTDLEYAERHTLVPGTATEPQVWLAADAPAGIVDRLQEEGLVIGGELDTDRAQASLDQAGAALALRFSQLAGGVAVLVGLLALALVVAVDRGAWGGSLRELRIQGLAERTTRRAVRWSYGAVVLAAAVAGAVAVGAAWLATRDRLPLGVDPSLLPSWPRWAPVLMPWTVVVGMMLVAAVAAAWWQRTEVRTEVRG